MEWCTSQKCIRLYGNLFQSGGLHLFSLQQLLLVKGKVLHLACSSLGTPAVASQDGLRMEMAVAVERAAVSGTSSAI